MWNSIFSSVEHQILRSKYYHVSIWFAIIFRVRRVASNLKFPPHTSYRHSCKENRKEEIAKSVTREKAEIDHRLPC